MTELLDRLNVVASKYGIDTTERWWPRGANWLGVRLQTMRQNLQREGIVFRQEPGWRAQKEYKEATGRRLETRTADVVIMERLAPRLPSWFDEPLTNDHTSQAIQDHFRTSEDAEDD